jgi:RNA polymerase sigma factor (sigma-70 family)
MMSPPHDPAQDASLILRIALGDDRAFEAFYARYQPAIVGFHLRRAGSRELAFDLAAETFATVLVVAARFDPAGGSPAGWLFGIAANKLRESMRRGRVEHAARRHLGMQPVAIDDHDLARVDELASLGDEHAILDLLHDLPATQRDAILARVVDEQPYAAIAADLECSEAVVRKRVARGLHALRLRLEQSR